MDKNYLNETFVLDKTFLKVEEGKPVLKNVKIHQAEIKNRNLRVYPKDILKKAFIKWQNDSKRDDSYKIMFADHIIRLFSGANVFQSVAGVIENTWWNESENAIYADIRLLPQFQGGKDIYNYINEGLKIGISARQIGSTENGDGTGKVTDLHILGWDFVFYPSFNFYTSCNDMVYETIEKFYECKDELCKIIEQINEQTNENKKNNKILNKNEGIDKMQEKEVKEMVEKYKKELEELKRENDNLKKKIEEYENKKIEEQKKPKITINNSQISYRAWSDVNKTRLRNILYESGNEAAIRECFAHVPDIEKMSTWGWPHHELRAVGENSYELILNYNGVMAAYKALAGARGGGTAITAKERREIARHLIKHFQNHLKREVPARLKQLAEAKDLEVEFEYDENQEIEALVLENLLFFITAYGLAEVTAKKVKVKDLMEKILISLKEAEIIKYDSEVTTDKEKLEKVVNIVKDNFEEEVTKENIEEFVEKLIKTIHQIHETLKQKELEKEIEVKKMEYKDIEEAEEIFKTVKSKEDLEQAIFRLELIKAKKEFDLPEKMLDEWFVTCETVEDIEREKAKLRTVLELKMQKEKDTDKVDEKQDNRDGDTGKDKETKKAKTITTIIDELKIKI